MTADYMLNLNEAQLRAVQHSPHIPLQILAGPGSGKTKVLTSRIAHLITYHNILPSSICAVTFTNKAANEMRERLTQLLGDHQTSQVRLGTFHSLCASFLRKHAKGIGLGENFTVCDADESKKIVKQLLEPYKDDLAKRNITLKEMTILATISKAKAKGQTAEDLLELCPKRTVQQSQAGTSDSSKESDSIAEYIDRTVAKIYREYEKTLRRSNSLDFDDLLVFGVKLFAEHQKAGEWCRHVLVDEFQDTNIMQYELMRHIAAASRCITIVGDPDQSIYGWRSAEIGNLTRMQGDFPDTQQILLEQNYRSTAAILAASVAIVAQDKTRIPKTLRTSHPVGPIPVLRTFPYESIEAAFIATEIKRLVASTGGMLRWSDFVVLLRFNSLSRSIESALQKEGIPNRVLGGHKFFERLEVKDILAYLQLVDNPQFVPAFTRAINVPSRGIGEKTISEILATAEKLQTSPLEVVERIYDDKMSDIRPPVKRKLASFLPPIRQLRKLAAERMPPADLIRSLLELIDYQNHLVKTQPDWESRWDNVQELINFASEVQATPPAREREDYSDEDWDVLEEFDRDQLEDEGIVELASRSDVKGKAKAKMEHQGDTPLRLFLQASMLSTDTGSQGDDRAKEKVTISTCHGAKGLEWPVVMIPAVEKGTFPSHRAEDIHEERRLLYVACTRAQGLLYLSYSTSRMVSGESKKKELSEFILPVLNHHQTLFTDRLPHLSQTDRVLLTTLLGRKPPDEVKVSKKLNEQHECSPLFSQNPRSVISNLTVKLNQQEYPPSDLKDIDQTAGSASEAPVFRSTRDTFLGVLPKQPIYTETTISHPTGMRTAFPTLKHPPRATSVSQYPQIPSAKPTGRTAWTNSSSTVLENDRRPNLLKNLPINQFMETSSPGATISSSPALTSITTDPDNRQFTSSASSVSSVGTPPGVQVPISSSAVQLAGGKRPLGMSGRRQGGYQNKKFKAPVSGA